MDNSPVVNPNSPNQSTPQVQSLPIWNFLTPYQNVPVKPPSGNIQTPYQNSRATPNNPILPTPALPSNPPSNNTPAPYQNSRATPNNPILPTPALPSNPPSSNTPTPPSNPPSNPSVTPRDVLAKRIQICDFICVEVVLYLDTHPTDKSALDYYAKYLELKKIACNEYARNYGPMTTDAYIPGEPWKWVENPWPWEREV